MTFGQHIRNMRLTQRMSIEHLAAATRLSTEHLWDLETNRAVVNLEEIAKLAAALDVAEDELMEKAPRLRSNAF